MVTFLPLEEDRYHRRRPPPPRVGRRRRRRDSEPRLAAERSDENCSAG